MAYFHERWGDGTVGLSEGINLEVVYYPAGFSKDNQFVIQYKEAEFPMIVSGIVKEPDTEYTKEFNVRYWMYAHVPNEQGLAERDLLRPVLIFSDPMPYSGYTGEVQWIMIPPNSVLESLDAERRDIFDWYDNRAAKLLYLSGILNVSFSSIHPHWNKEKGGV
ncbi:MAG: hypothetical protein BSOLF_0525 [Candidatus Carbobacillus altaicus]|uniref:Uncharacterized protein n=1 Tax=Candidatus Carbonibacillus altaicus TaxID=2163959 RepID=A0A2R6Y0N6_9BACL|nr:MAG: hypothetical protein BSOLF_0525 [Candidatus Carbobacillus altaicus]